MKAKLIHNPLISDTMVNGLILENIYKVIEVFSSNPYDKYFRIIDDNGEEQAWNSENFEVIEQDIIYPAIYRHFKHGHYYATVGIAKPVSDIEFKKMHNASNDGELYAEYTEIKMLNEIDIVINEKNIVIIKNDGELYAKGTEELVIYVSLYDNHIFYARPLEMFAGLTDKIKYPESNQKFKFELVRY